METPCINICSLDPHDRLCVGCFRSIDEIMAWAAYTDAERRAIMAELPCRSARHHGKTIQETADA